jgi:hypothetical protein
LEVRIISTASLTEFLGYGAASEAQPNNPKGRQPMPHVRLTQITAHDSVPDGYSLAVAGKIAGAGKDFVVVLTPTLVDETGKRMHTDGEIESITR